MENFHFLLGFIYLGGVLACFSQLVLRLKSRFPTIEFDFHMKIAVIILCCFSWIGLFFVITNDELNS